MIVPDHWLVRGAQSAIFFYISCGPCSAQSATRKRRKEAARDKKLKDEKLAAQPHLYPHPGPSETNQYWQEDMDIGPSHMAKRPRKGTKDSQSRPLTNGSVRNSGSITPTRGIRGSSDEKPPEKKLYKRVDEEYEWNSSQEEKDRIEEERRRNQSRWDYGLYRAPAINHMHPPVIGTIPSKPEDRRWMKEPPPSHAFINGRLGVKAINKSEVRQGTIIQPLRENALPLVSEKSKRPIELSPLNNSASAIPSRLTSVSSRSNSARSSYRKPRPHHLRLHDSTSASSSDADDEDEPYLASITRPKPAHHAASRRRSTQRPHLQTIVSDSVVPTFPNFSPALQSQSTNSVTISPHASPRSATSIPSPISTSDETLPSPRLAPLQSGPRSGRKTFSGSADSAIVLEDDASAGAERRDSISELDWAQLLSTWNGLNEEKAREQMWLGPAPNGQKRMVVEKRWSTDF